jgi:hypothetical protein
MFYENYEPRMTKALTKELLYSYNPFNLFVGGFSM